MKKRKNYSSGKAEMKITYNGDKRDSSIIKHGKYEKQKPASHVPSLALKNSGAWKDRGNEEKRKREVEERSVS